ncbi:MAG TPA: hypothetical protein VK178_07925 [Opitutaceae bacterium]|nr:hypothetical protein [Opitutaceae bacterium]
MLHAPRWLTPALLALAALAGPASSTAAAGSIELVPQIERSRSFAAVAPHLELGGTLYGYVDIDGDVEHFAGILRGLVDNIATEMPQAAVFQQDYAKIATDVGFADVKAIGLSSVAVEGGFRNRCFLYTPGGRHGLLAALGGPAAPFHNLALAPANAHLFCENEVDLPAAYSAIRGVVAYVAGQATANLVDAQLKETQKQAGFSAYDLIQQWKGRVTCVARFEDRAPIRLPSPKPVRIPAFSLLLRVDGIAPTFRALLDSVPAFERTVTGAATVYALKEALPIEGWTPLLAIEGDALYLATSRAFFDDCVDSRGPRLDANPDLAAALALLGREGNGLTFVSPEFLTRLRQLVPLNAEANPEFVRSLKLVLANLPQDAKAMVSVRSNLPDGILVRSSSYSSLKENLAALAVYNPVTIGALAAMAVPAFEKVRSQSQEKAILNNLRQLSAAAEQYYLENGTTTATYDNLVGENGYIGELRPVQGEDYRSIVFELGKPLRLRLPNGRVLETPAP